MVPLLGRLLRATCVCGSHSLERTSARAHWKNTDWIEITSTVAGAAQVSVDPALIARCIVDGKAPATVLVISIQSVFFQCARALVRSKLWDPQTQVARSSLPSNGTILTAVSQAPFDGVAYDASQPARMQQTLY